MVLASERENKKKEQLKTSRVFSRQKSKLQPGRQAYYPLLRLLPYCSDPEGAGQ